jgi:hypothetical protein
LVWIAGGGGALIILGVVGLAALGGSKKETPSEYWKRALQEQQERLARDREKRLQEQFGFGQETAQLLLDEEPSTAPDPGPLRSLETLWVAHRLAILHLDGEAELRTLDRDARERFLDAARRSLEEKGRPPTPAATRQELIRMLEELNRHERHRFAAAKLLDTQVQEEIGAMRVAWRDGSVSVVQARLEDGEWRVTLNPDADGVVPQPDMR